MIPGSNDGALRGERASLQYPERRASIGEREAMQSMMGS